MTHNPVRPWRNIDRRRSRRIHVGPVAGRRRRADQRADDDQHADHRRRARRSPRCRPAPTPAPTSSASRAPTRPRRRALREIVRESPVPIVADIHFHYRRAIEAAEAGAACLRINPGNIGSTERVREVIRAARDHGCSMRIGVNAGSLEKHLLEKYGEPCPEAMVESGARPHPHPRGQRLPRVQDQREGLRRLPRRRRLPGARRGDRRPDPPRHHRGRRADDRHGQVGDRPRQPALDGHRRHHPRQPLGRSGRGGARRLRDPEGARPAPPRRQHHLLPVLRPAGVRRDPDGRGRWRSGWSTSGRRCRCRSSAAWSTARARR